MSAAGRRSKPATMRVKFDKSVSAEDAERFIGALGRAFERAGGRLIRPKPTKPWLAIERFGSGYRFEFRGGQRQAKDPDEAAELLKHILNHASTGRCQRYGKGNCRICREERRRERMEIQE